MNTQVCQPAVQPASAGRTNTVVGRDGFLRSITDALARYWRERQLRARARRRLDAIGEIDARMLKDIGAPNWMIAEATARDTRRGLRFPDAS